MKLTDLIPALKALYEQRYGEPVPCWRCEGHKTVCIYDISDEYAAPCPVCIGSADYHAEIRRRNFGHLPKSLEHVSASPASLGGKI